MLFSLSVVSSANISMWNGGKAVWLLRWGRGSTKQPIRVCSPCECSIMWVDWLSTIIAVVIVWPMKHCHATLTVVCLCLYQRGDRVAVRGYWGDIVSSPYLSFGTETENKNLLKKQNNQHVKVKELVHYLPFKVTDNLIKVQVHICSF